MYAVPTYMYIKHVNTLKLSPSIGKSKETLVIARKVVIIVVHVTH